MIEIDSVDFHGLKLSIFEDSDFDSLISKTIIEKQNIIVYGYSIGLMPKFKTNPDLANICNTFDLMATDGIPLYFIARALGFRLKSSLSIPDLTLRAMSLASKNGWKVLIIGGTEKNNKLAVEKLRIDFNGAIIPDGINGFFKDEQFIITKIKKESPDILLIGLPTPIKEYFAYKYKQIAHVNIPCGGMIDVFAGSTKLTPRFIKKSGFAWLYRFVQQPKTRFRLTMGYLFSFLFKLLPVLIFISIFKKNRKLSIPSFYSKKI
jgi:N-acetylglucosaminyldiphosphoundecaprenol N-acetyl-beta-D-mannosaminyltransferase